MKNQPAGNVQNVPKRQKINNKQHFKSHAIIAGLEVRQVAAKLLSAVIDKKTSLDGLTDHEHGHPQYLKLEPRDRALCRAIIGASLRHRADIQEALAKFLERPLPQNALSLNHILHCAVAQILYLDIPDHATIDLAVTIAKLDPRNRRFSKLINAILRKIAQNRTALLEEEKSPINISRKANISRKGNIPSWFYTMLVKNYGHEKTNAILFANNFEPPLDLTRNKAAKNAPDSATMAKNLNAVILPNGSLRIKKLEKNLTELEGFIEGAWFVQDVAASLPAKLFGDIKGKNIADLCAAPGGKTAQLAMQGANVTALDISKNRLKRLETNMQRLQLKVTTFATNLKDFKPENLFDGVLLDAPCSSTGTIRRHPDILWTKDLSDVEKLAKLQFELLNTAITFTKSGGLIVFSNCSLAFEEGEWMIEKLLKSRDDVEISPILSHEIGNMENLITKAGTLRTTPADLVLECPQMSGMDGFFAARLQKK